MEKIKNEKLNTIRHPEGETRRISSRSFKRFFACAQNDVKKGFTLAEVLITLGIIGVVAALTIPNLVANYQKKAYVTGLQRGISTLSQTFKMILATEGVDLLSNSSVFQAININNDADFLEGDQSQLIEKLGKYMKITDSCHNPSYDETEEGCNNPIYMGIWGNGSNSEDHFKQCGRVKVYTADGIVYYLRLYKEQKDNYAYSNIIGRIEIDVNGDNEPNVIGRDLFSVLLLNDGQIVFIGTKTWADAKWSKHWSEIGPDDYSYSEYFTARVFENGWKMDY